MSNSGPTKQEIEIVFNRLRAQPANKSCFDCAAKAPTWSSVTYGVFICIDCSAVHRGLGVHLTFVRSTNLDTNWTWLQLRQMQLGGNANAASFFRQHNCATTDAQQKYNSRAAQLYRDKLTGLAQQAMKVHGTKLHLDNAITDKSEGNDAAETGGEEEDFFAECANDNIKSALFENNNSEKIDVTQKIISPTLAEKLNSPLISQPSVDLLNSIAPPTNVPSSIGVRKIQPKKSGLGARKTGGLGATKVKTNFAEIEQRANLADQCKDASDVPEKSLTVEEEIESVASMRLAYQDLSMQKTREENKLKTIDPVKAKQMERLGMGFSLRGSDVSHSAISDMETIQQVTSAKNVTQSKASGFENDSFFSDYSPRMYSGSGNGGGGGNNSNSSTGGFSTTSKADKHELEMMGFETIEPIGSQHSNITSMFSGSDSDNKPTATASEKRYGSNAATDRDSYARKPNASNKNIKSYEETAAQKKFGSAKGFGSDQYFGNEQAQPDVASNLSRFQGSNSISSSDYFGDGNSNATNRGTRGYNTAVNFQAPDLDDVKESVRQGVHKVAGRLSTLATDVMSSLQDKYGY